MAWRTYVSRGYFSLTPYTDTWRPLFTLGTRAVASLAGRSPAPHRAPWLLLHLLAGALLAGLAASLGLPAQTAAWGAALFLLHPAQVESLMCATHSSTVMAGAGLLGMLRAHRAGRHALAAAAFAFAMLSKEHGLLGLPLAALMDVLATGGLSPRPYAGYAALAAAYGAARFGWFALPGGLAPAIPWADRLLLGAQAWATAWRVLALPAGLRIEYFAVPPRGAEAAAWLLAAALIAAALAWLGAALWRRSRPALFFALLPIPLLAAVSPLSPADVLTLRLTAERFLYAPAAGFAVTVAWLLRGRPGILAALLALWTGLSAARAAAWADETRLWGGLARHYPWSSKAHEGLGDAWLRKGRHAEAAAAYEAALAARRERGDRVLAYYVPLTPALGWERASLHRGLGLARLGLGEPEEAAKQLRRAIELAPASEGLAYRALAYLEASRGRFAEAQAVARGGLERAPSDAFLQRLERDAAAGRLGFRAEFR
ncbi:MAG: hypothetical protein HY554_10180 [Elusimicrobia bacterium]|nr:hypothetical protein [Elusimicrobiota bacterium]